jgi:hypothetical protein
LFGHKWGKIEQGYQCCEVCGKAKGCFHLWTQFTDFHKVETSAGAIHVVFEWKCKYCGEIRQYNTTTGQYS